MSRSEQPAAFNDAQDRLFHEIRRCGVLEADTEDVEPWLGDTVGFLSELYPSLTTTELGELKRAGRNYVAPVIPHGHGKDAKNREEWIDEVGDEEPESV